MTESEGTPARNPAWKRIAGLAGLILLLALQIMATTSNWDEVLIDGRVYFVDADCYSRMTRVAAILDGGPWSLRSHSFENWPDGTRPHTTAGMDLLIAGGARTLGFFGISNSTDWAGAWISPLLGALTLIILWAWGGVMNLRFRWAMLLLIAVSPILAQAFKFGRPDHQSLVLFLITVGTALEALVWRKPGHRAVIVAWGLVWGSALWVSLYEPVILLGAILILRFGLLRGAAWTQGKLTGLSIAAGVFAVTLLMDGWRFGGSPPEVAEFFPRWAEQIGELAKVSLFSSAWFSWVGWLAPFGAFALAWNAWKERNPLSGLWIGMILLTTLLTMWQLRWGCYFAIVTAIALPFALQSLPVRSFVLAAGFILSLWPVADAWDWNTFPSPELQAKESEQIAERVQLREIAEMLRSGESRAILAPWWLTPPLVYWSGQPGVAGSSHQSLPGTVASAQFFLAGNPQSAMAILRDRKVRYVILDDPERTLSTSASLLQTEPTANALGRVLFEHPSKAGEWSLRFLGRTSFFVVFEVAE